ncbi:MAG: hypothetical protein MUC36_04330 [Planctomycetes bacterium]|jgi:hypothetical protein|nr:hypothetical protein [Planctomycetota bacterium]
MPLFLPLALALVLLLPACGEQVRGSHAESVATIREQPLRVKQQRLPVVDVDAEVWARIVATFGPRVRRNGALFSTPSICLHCLRLHGLNARFADELIDQSEDVLAALLQFKCGKQLFHSRIAVKTRFGARFRPPSMLPQAATAADESHIDQVLAGLLELGLPLTSRLELDDAQVELRDVVVDSIANFSIEQPELEWTAISLILSLPPVRSWQNKYRESFSFDQLAEKLLSRSPEFGACAGIHALNALVLLSSVDTQVAVLDPDVAARVRRGVADRLTRIIANQREDGAWGLNWYSGLAEERVTADTLALVTGHLGECLLMVPEDMRVPTDTLRRAGEWLYRYLRDHLTPDSLAQAYCPMTHAAVTVRQLRR